MGGARITPAQRHKAREMRHKWGYTLQAISDRLGIAKSAVHKIVGAYQAREKTDQERAAYAIRLYDAGYSPSVIARMVDRTVYTGEDIYRILKDNGVHLRRIPGGRPRKESKRLCGNKECDQKVSREEAICAGCMPQFDRSI